MNKQLASPENRCVKKEDGSFECSTCGRCCSAILCVSKTELKKIKKYLREHPEVKLTNRNNVVATEFKDVCPFLNGENRCGIYAVRPEICRHFLCANYQDPSVAPMNHRDKTIVNMITEFMPDSPCPSTPNLTEINRFYEARKKLAYGK